MHHEIVVSFVKAQTDLWRPLRLSEKLLATRGSFLTLYDALCAFSQMETLVRAARCLKQIRWEQNSSKHPRNWHFNYPNY